MMIHRMMSPAAALVIFASGLAAHAKPIAVTSAIYLSVKPNNSDIKNMNVTKIVRDLIASKSDVDTIGSLAELFHDSKENVFKSITLTYKGSKGADRGVDHTDAITGAPGEALTGFRAWILKMRGSK